MKGRFHRWNRRERTRGSVFVEMSLSFIGVAIMLLGAFDFAQFLFVHQALVERARSSVRWGAINSLKDTAQVKNMVLYNQPTTPTLGKGAYLGLKPENVVVTTPDAATDNYRMVVEVTNYKYNVLSPFVAGVFTAPKITAEAPVGLIE